MSDKTVLRVILKEDPRPSRRTLASRKLLVEKIMDRRPFRADLLTESSSQESVVTRPEVDGQSLGILLTSSGARSRVSPAQLGKEMCA